MSEFSLSKCMACELVDVQCKAPWLPPCIAAELAELAQGQGHGRGGMMITGADVKLLEDILHRWHWLSQHPDATDCQTDSCHTELAEGELLVTKLREIVEAEQAKATGGK